MARSARARAGQARRHRGAQKAALRKPGAQIVVGIDHPNYGHVAVMPEPVRTALAEDLD
jgi:hypothetical protein